MKAKEEVGSEGPASRAPWERTRGRCQRGAGAAPGGGGCAQPLWLVEYVHQEFWFVSRRRLGHGIHLHPHHRIPAVAIFLTLVGAFWAIRWYLACRRIRGRHASRGERLKREGGDSLERREEGEEGERGEEGGKAGRGPRGRATAEPATFTRALCEAN